MKTRSTAMVVLALLTAPSQYARAAVVISQIYGGGGNTGSTYTNDFIELFNAGAFSQSLNGWSVQYAAAANTTWSTTPLPDFQLQPGQYFLVAEASGGGGMTALPTPDVSGTLNLSATTGKVALSSGTAALSGSCPNDASIRDLVGYGAAATCFETAAATGTSTNVQAIARGEPCADSDDNSSDFAVVTAAPRNTSTAAVTCATAGSNLIFHDGFDAYPLLRYRFDGDGANTGTLAGYAMTVVDSSFATGKIGQGVKFGSGGYGHVAGMRGVLGIYAQITIAFWFYETAPLSAQSMWSDINRSTPPYGGVQIGESANTSSACVATTTNSLLGGNCNGFASPGTSAWHHWIIRYAGTGTGSGQGGPTEIYVDDVLKLTRANDVSNNPVFTTAIPDEMTIGGSGAIMDDLEIFNRVFTQAEQCIVIIGGSWNGSCTLP